VDFFGRETRSTRAVHSVAFQLWRNWDKINGAILYHGGCHCGAVAFEVEGELREVEQRNCSICTRKAYLHWFVPPESFRLLTGKEALTTYSFNTGVARHYFCARCGVAPFYVPRSDPDKIDVNVRCLDDVDLDALMIRSFDGRLTCDGSRRH
jgi:hypothetical protein